MLTASNAFNATINGLAQTVVGHLEIDLPTAAGVDFTGSIVSVNIDASNTTDLPDGVRDAAGYSTLGGSLVLAGTVTLPGATTIRAADLFNPDNRSSPLFRLKVRNSPVRFSWGVRPVGSAAEPLRKFTGVLADVTLDHESGQVTCTLVDISALWKSLPTVPGVVTVAPYNAGLTSEFALDQIIRSVNGSSSWPARRPQCMFAAGMRSSVWPDVGQLDYAVGQATSFAGARFVPGKFGSALAGEIGQPSEYLIVAYDLAAAVPAATTDWFAEYWVTCGSSGSVELRISDGQGEIATNVYVSFAVSGAEVVVGMEAGSLGATWPSVAFPADGKAHYVGMHLSWVGSSGTVTVNIDGAITNCGSQAIGGRAAGPATNANVIIDASGSTTVEAVQFSTEASPAWNDGFVPAAVLDPSLNPLTVIPEIDPGGSAWDVIQQIAEAEFGYARIDENGIFRFSNRLTILGQQPQRTVDSRVSLATLTTSIGASTEYNHIQVPYTSWTFGARTDVWSATSVIKVAGHSTKTWTQTLDTSVAALAGLFTSLPNGHAINTGGSYYRASSDSAGVNEHPGVTITVTQVSAGTVQFTVVNGSSLTAYLISPANYTDLAVATPALWLGGIPVTPADEALVDVTYGAADSLLTVSSNPYIQDDDTARTLGGFLLNQLFYAIRDFTDVAIVPDARIQVADLIHLLDTLRGSGIDEYALVWGWSFSASFPQPGQSGGTWAMTLNLRALGPPDAWLGGITGRSEAADSPTPSWAYA